MNMINNKDDQEKELEEAIRKSPKPTNESSGIYVRGFVKISDPESGEILVHTAD